MRSNNISNVNLEDITNHSHEQFNKNKNGKANAFLGFGSMLKDKIWANGKLSE